MTPPSLKLSLDLFDAVPPVEVAAHARHLFNTQGLSLTPEQEAWAVAIKEARAHVATAALTARTQAFLAGQATEGSM